MLKIAQLSDLHLFAEPTQAAWDHNPQAQFEAVLDLALKQQPDALLLTGDLVHDESTEGYQQLQQRLHATGLATLAIPGNHDNPELIARYFGKPQLALPGLTLLGLDSHINGSDCGFLGSDQIQHIDTAISNSQTPVLLAIHHPPIAVGSEWIDALGLADAEDFEQLLSKHQQTIVGVVCGHVHQVHKSQLHGIPLHSCPSTGRQFLPAAKSFATDTLKPGFCLHQWNGKNLKTTVLRLP